MNSCVVRLWSLGRRPLQRALLALWVLLSVTALVPRPSHASLFSILEDLAKVGSKSARMGETAAARGGGVALSAAERAALAAAVLSSAGAAAYLTGAGEDVLLYLAGTQSPLRLLSKAADVTADIGGRLQAGETLIVDSTLAERLGTQSESLAERYRLAIANGSMQSCGVHYAANATTSSPFVGRKRG